MFSALLLCSCCFWNVTLPSNKDWRVLCNRAFSCGSQSYLVALAQSAGSGPCAQGRGCGHVLMSSACSSHNLIFRQTKLWHHLLQKNESQ